ncbi:gamma-glutamylcyclotransferase [Spirulina subsalsa]|uniref:allophanate hydrolase-related protein n=1 Tax=Spirulina subsalsa TaxID=54311 RepID=UPI0002F7FFFE|nr:gamma-glutamylcyclotransferase [Spirulina subsalsa]
MSDGVLVFICGSALRGQPDHGTIADTELVKVVSTQPRYRLHSVEDKHPGVYEVAQGGIAIVGELYKMTQAQYAHLLSNEPPHLYPGPILLEDGTEAIAMLYPREVIEERQYVDISHYGGWAAYKADQG